MSVIRKSGDNAYVFWCVACDETHRITDQWTVDLETNTIQPSVLVTSGHYIAGHNGKSCWCTYNAEHKDNPSKYRCTSCHSFVTNGQIEYLSDSTHEYAGKTVALPDVEDKWL